MKNKIEELEKRIELLYKFVYKVEKQLNEMIQAVKPNIDDKRDYFAAHSPFTVETAINVLYLSDEKKKTATTKEISHLLSEMNYIYANTMLTERKKYLKGEEK